MRLPQEQERPSRESIGAIAGGRTSAAWPKPGGAPPAVAFYGFDGQLECRILVFVSFFAHAPHVVERLACSSGNFFEKHPGCTVSAPSPRGLSRLWAVRQETFVYVPLSLSLSPSLSLSVCLSLSLSGLSLSGLSLSDLSLSLSPALR